MIFNNRKKLRKFALAVLVTLFAAPTTSKAEIELLGPREKKIISNPFRAGRSMTMSRHGIVASSQTLASQAGLDILRQGGNAMDAAVATAATLCVVEPMMTGLGGDVWILYCEAASGKVYALNGSGRSPKALTREYFDAKEKPKIVATSWESVTVPGAVDAYATGLDRFGSLSMAEVLAPAIRYAEEGFPVTEVIGSMWKAFGKELRKDEAANKALLVNGEAPKIGEVFKNPLLAKTLRQIAEGGRDAFYEGPIAEEIVRYAQATGGFLSMEDFAEHRSEWMEPIKTNYRGYDVYQCPPNGQGIAVLLMLNILENFDLASMDHGSAEYLHLLIEAKKLAFADIGKYVADPDTAEMPTVDLLSKAYAKERAKLIDPAAAKAAVDPGTPRTGDTIYLTTIDEEGNSASFINSLFAAFGSKIVGGDTGIPLQNRGSGFTLEKGHINEYAPGKRPFHTIIPGMVLKDDKLYLSYGLMGGAMQPQGHVQLLTNHIDFGYTIQESIDLPRWRHEVGKLVFLEHGTELEVKEALDAMGHQSRGIGGAMFGGAQVILVDPATGTYIAGSDPRKDGSALGY